MGRIRRDRREGLARSSPLDAIRAAIKAGTEIQALAFHQKSSREYLKEFAKGVTQAQPASGPKALTVRQAEWLTRLQRGERVLLDDVVLLRRAEADPHHVGPRAGDIGAQGGDARDVA